MSRHILYTKLRVGLTTMETSRPPRCAVLLDIADSDGH